MENWMKMSVWIEKCLWEFIQEYILLELRKRFVKIFVTGRLKSRKSTR